MVGKDLLKILKESKYTTVLSGFEMLQENGYPAIRDGEESYDIEQKYGYSVDEMFTSAFYSTRKPQFFELIYRQEKDIWRWRSWKKKDFFRQLSQDVFLVCRREQDVRM